MTAVYHPGRYLLLQKLSVFLLNDMILEPVRLAQTKELRYTRRMRTYVSPSRSTPLLRLIEGMFSNLLRERPSELPTPAGTKLGPRF